MEEGKEGEKQRMMEERIQEGRTEGKKKEKQVISSHSLSHRTNNDVIMAARVKPLCRQTTESVVVTATMTVN